MRNFIFLLISTITLTFSLSGKSFPSKEDLTTKTYVHNKGANSRIIPITKGNFLIVGSFSYQKNAEKFANYLKDKAHNVSLGFYKGNGHYYVYIYESTDLNKVRSKRDEVRSHETFKDAWVLKVGDKLAAKITANGNEAVIPETQPVKELRGAEASTETTSTINKNVKRYKVYLNTIEATTFKEVPGNIKMIFGDRGKVGGIYESHKAQIIEVPVDQKQDVQFVCEVFGYKKVEQDLNFNNPVNDDSKSYTKMLNDTIMLDFELLRYKKGEIFTMFNVFFYNDAAIMLPKSTYELNELVRMVKENENLVIKLHGHTNGTQGGPIIKLAEGDKAYFDIKPTNIHTKGSAKELSHERANVIRQYLIEQGISEKRIEVKGWGGTKMLYPAKSPDAKKNVRVEIEILRD